MKEDRTVPNLIFKSSLPRFVSYAGDKKEGWGGERIKEGKKGKEGMKREWRERGEGA